MAYIRALVLGFIFAYFLLRKLSVDAGHPWISALSARRSPSSVASCMSKDGTSLLISIILYILGAPGSHVMTLTVCSRNLWLSRELVCPAAVSKHSTVHKYLKFRSSISSCFANILRCLLGQQQLYCLDRPVEWILISTFRGTRIRKGVIGGEHSTRPFSSHVYWSIQLTNSSTYLLFGSTFCQGL